MRAVTQGKIKLIIHFFTITLNKFIRELAKKSENVQLSTPT